MPRFLPYLALVLTLAGLCNARPARALAPEEVLVLANRNAAKSQGLASFYMKQRGIPESNRVLLWMTDQETCTWSAYEKKAMPPVRRFLEKNPNIRAVVTFYGLPLRIADPGQDPHMTAAFDSELALVKAGSYTLKNWQPNPFYLGFKDKTPPIPKEKVLMVSRLDGSSGAVVRRIIRDSLAAEKEGVKGTAYFDARWPFPGKGRLSGYAYYDRSIHKAARFHEQKGILPVVLDDKEELFPAGACPDTLIYCGWYSLGKYVDSFKWVKGSVGYHIASVECTTLKQKESRVWCKSILDNGAAATIGPVGEPYVQSFPVPEIFFNLLTEGVLTLAEAYFVSLPYVSWKMVLIGDPLYRLNIQH